MLKAGADHHTGRDWAELWYGDATARVGRAFLPLLLNESRWIERRVEQIEVLDRAWVRRRVSIDFHLRPRRPGAELEEGPASITVRPRAGSIPIPLALFRKAPLRDFDISDEGGQPLIVWTREQNCRVAAALLLQLAGDTVEKRGALMSRRVAVDIARVAEGFTEGLANAAWGRLENPVPGDPDEVVRRHIRRSDVTWAMFKELRDQFVLVADIHEPLDRRRIVKLSYEESLTASPESGGLVNFLLRVGRSLLETVGWAPFTMAFPTPAVVDAASYHVEVAAPEDVSIASASLRVIVPAPDGGEREREVATDRNQERAHLFVSRELADWQGWSLDNVVRSLADVRFSLKPGGLVTASALTSGLTTGLLWFGLYLHQRHIAPRPEAATAVLVVLPAVYAAYLAPGGDSLRRRMSLALRALVGVSSLIAFAAASALAVEMKAHDVVTLWHGLAVTSTAVTSVLAVSFLMAWIRQRLS